MINTSTNNTATNAQHTSSTNSKCGNTESTSGDEHVARCVALEKAYVHEVYEQFNETPCARPWPKIQQFLQDLEPGSLVCDVGCGSGKYLNVNQSIFKIGADRCSRLTEVAREKENEVLLCDNLSLPFRDESFDAVLSVAVIHHFATTERRVGALKELARLLRIGGKLIISVWAMEQRHRKFESQDVLVPWHRPQHLSTPSLELTSTTNTSEEDMLPPYHAYTQTSDSDSNRSLRHAVNGFRKRGRTKHKGRSIDPNCSSSPSSSSLSSPNETCYSFVRRALQKLAGGRRSANRHRPWFLESWNYCSKEPTHPPYDLACDDNEDIHDLPIELRRIEEGELLNCSKQNSLDLYKSGQKSKSLGDIQTVKQDNIIRSASNTSNLKISNLEELNNKNETENNSVDKSNVPNVVPTNKSVVPPSRPKLVKQKQSLNEEDGEDLDKPLNQRDVVEALPDFRLIHSHYGRQRGSVFKQSSMNEELLSTERLREKERVKKNIQKQASLNDDLIYRRYRTLDSLRDSFLSVSTSKRFQLIKNGFTNKLKTSTTSIEKVTGTSLKNGFVRILQGWKAETVDESVEDTLQTQKAQHITTVTEETQAELPNERRHSREDGSDSSKDSSLQSDTSVDSEDSFASVIFVPKQDSQEITSPTPLSPANQPTSPRFKSSSGPTSPRIKQSSCPTSPRLKQMPLSVYPLLKQPTSPKTAQLKQVPSGGKVLIYSQSTPCTKPPQVSNNSSTNGNKTNNTVVEEPKNPVSPPSTTQSAQISPTSNIVNTEPIVESSPKVVESSPPKDPNPLLSSINSTECSTNEKTIPVIPITKLSDLSDQKTTSALEKYRSLAEKYKLQQIPAFRSFSKPFAIDKTRTDRLQQIRDLLNQRPNFGKRAQTTHSQRTSSTPTFPMVRRSSVQISGKTEPVAKSLPRLLSLELFNPETDDMDSDSSGMSSPDSVDSVISVEVSESQSKSSENNRTKDEEKKSKEPSPEKRFEKSTVSTIIEEVASNSESEQESTKSDNAAETLPKSMSLFEAAANVASSLDDAVGAVIQSSPRSKHKEYEKIEQSKILEVVTLDKDFDNDFFGENFNNTMLKRNNKPDEVDVDAENKTESTQFPFDNIQIVDDIAKDSSTYNNWSNNCLQHLAEFAEKISEGVLRQIDEYQEENKKYQQKNLEQTSSTADIETKLDAFNDPYIHKLNEEIKDLTKLSAELTKERNMYLTKLNNDNYQISDNFNNLCDSSDSDLTKHLENKDETKVDVNSSIIIPEQGSQEQQQIINKNNNNSSDSLSLGNTKIAQLLTGLSQESSDTGDISERTGSSEWSYSRAETNSVGITTTTCSVGGSTASLNSCKDWTKSHRRLTDRRSTSEDIPEVKRAPLVRQHASFQEPLNLETNNTQPESLNISLSDTSQESLPSDSAGGAITYHRYYHVFREGELDQLIERYVENLHIISSYYDHASWCVVAEKVQVWTI
ncbi:uncharacterized protein LOC123298849 [Chrysoperla carnea]|uniref:uncharacterized protein LOC123298849 n=1 Tax=Chrysoperla carnea TaxID=189513 RepID=UPI001D07B634|nr:uncharacterized protein LOC123298849 [Chrysoperla carnea]